jgi:hypothetical protein
MGLLEDELKELKEIASFHAGQPPSLMGKPRPRHPFYLFVHADYVQPLTHNLNRVNKGEWVYDSWIAAQKSSANRRRIYCLQVESNTEFDILVNKESRQTNAGVEGARWKTASNFIVRDFLEHLEKQGITTKDLAFDSFGRLYV